MNGAAALYIDLLKRCVGNFIYDDDLDLLAGPKVPDPASSRLSTREGVAADPAARIDGLVWPSRAHTMIGLRRLDNLQHCVEEAIRCGIPGDLIETGVWRGGATIFMRGILKAYGIVDRRVWVADSFDGLPAPDPLRYPKESRVPFHQFADLAVSQEQVRRNFERYGLLDEQVCFLKGWFRDTLPAAPIERLAVMRLDGDLYESTMDALRHLYGKLSPGGFVIVDDYNTVQACNDAVHDFRGSHGITAELSLLPGAGAFWRK